MRIAIADARQLAGAGHMDGHLPIMILRVDRHAAGIDEFRRYVYEILAIRSELRPVER